jgi:hypothetical protein
LRRRNAGVSQSIRAANIFFSPGPKREKVSWKFLLRGNLLAAILLLNSIPAQKKWNYSCRVAKSLLPACGCTEKVQSGQERCSAGSYPLPLVDFHTVFNTCVENLIGKKYLVRLSASVVHSRGPR